MNETMFTPPAHFKIKIAATSWGNSYEYKMIDDPNFGYYVEECPDMFKYWRNYTLVGEVNDGNSFYGNKGVAGHTGFTGTQVIIDPEENLQIILLTNKQNNGPLPSGSYRSTGALSKQVANIVYESLN